MWLLAEIIRLVVVHTPDGQAVQLNPQAVIQLRVPQKVEGHFPPGVKCIVNTFDGKITSTVEDCQTIARELGSPSPDN
jgi:hypothetical protein